MGWKKTVMALAFLTGLAGCASEEAAVKISPLPKVDSQFTPKKVWSKSVGNGIEDYYSTLKPVVEYGKVYAADRKGYVVALDEESGKEQWSNDLEDDNSARLSGGIVASYGKIFIGTENAEVIALNSDTGDEEWRSEVDGEVLATPLVDEGLVIVNTSKGTLEALDSETGEEKWKLNNDIPSLSLRGDSSAVTVSGGVFWGMANGRLGAAFIKNGNYIWQQPIGNPKGATEIDRLVDVDATPVIVGDRLITVGYNGSLMAIDLRSGQSVWRRTYSSAKDLAVDSDHVYLITDKDHIVAVDLRSGTEIWQNQDLAYRNVTAPRVIDNKVVVGDQEGYLHWLDPDSGNFVAQQDVGGDGIAVPPVAVSNGYLLQTRNGDLKLMQLP
ncbi:outer membrane protein assembly factor BamB [Vibrio sp. SS-MA-C1-2]|uniref:outer membrane protein assembly factor BamB n=1 Tax=Vibrio sp. SS-MA-C1-2 TaxID=2908646 RepID=UPI001F32CC64|nr:outer membrane protein assembly factor BamB [Vibrio sp. SS-MA-C1-2]UJF18955.1 outer membrane protein assembly factor BamB [Vibrio sp. SS-MA-C1-2]